MNPEQTILEIVKEFEAKNKIGIYQSQIVERLKQKRPELKSTRQYVSIYVDVLCKKNLLKRTSKNSSTHLILNKK